MTQSIQEQIAIFPPIESEGHFFEVRRKMFCADVMPRSANPSLEQRERIFDSIGMRVTHHIDAFGVVNRLVFFGWNASLLHCGRIRWVVVSEDYIYVFADILTDILGHCFGPNILRVEEAKLPATLPNTNNDFLIFKSLVSSTAPIYSADIGFIHFDFSIKHGLVSLSHSSANTMAEIPRSFVAYSDGTLNLTSRDTFLGFAEKQCSHEPFGQREMRVIKDRSSCDTELIVAILAVEEFLIGFEFNSCLLAARALDASGPAKAAQKFTAPLVSRKLSSYVC